MFRITLNALATLTLLLACAVFANAQTPRTFVSTEGNDANPCTRAQPCRTFTQALIAVQAGGEVIVLDSGDYEPFTITKAVTVQTAPGVYAGINVASGTGITINAGIADAVTLRGLTIMGASTTQFTTGIDVNSLKSLMIDNCMIEGMNGSGVSLTTNIGGTLLYSIRNTTTRNNNLHGISVIPGNADAKATIDNCHIENNSEGVVVVSNAEVSIRNSVVSGNSMRGLRASSAGAQLTIDSCLVANNDVGVYSNSQGFARLSNTTVANNRKGIQVFSNGSMGTYGNNRLAGNLNGNDPFTVQLGLL